jgi:hypothetical protein
LPAAALDSVSEDIARSVVKACDRGIVTETGRGSFHLRGGVGTAAIFWHGKRSKRPRPVIFAHEGLISVALAYELSRLGWRPYQMDFEVLADAFDLGVFDPRSNRMLIVGEAKTQDDDVDKLIGEIRSCGARGAHRRGDCRNELGHSKYAGLIAGKPEVLVVRSPGVRRASCAVYLQPQHVKLLDIEDSQVDELLRRPKKGLV